MVWRHYWEDDPPRHQEWDQVDARRREWAGTMIYLDYDSVVHRLVVNGEATSFFRTLSEKSDRLLVRVIGCAVEARAREAVGQLANAGVYDYLDQIVFTECVTNRNTRRGRYERGRYNEPGPVYQVERFKPFPERRFLPNSWKTNRPPLDQADMYRWARRCGLDLHEMQNIWEQGKPYHVKYRLYSGGPDEYICWDYFYCRRPRRIIFVDDCHFALRDIEQMAKERDHVPIKCLWHRTLKCEFMDLVNKIDVHIPQLQSERRRLAREPKPNVESCRRKRTRTA